MTWINKGSLMGLRLTKKEGDLFYEIGQNYGLKGLCLDVEDTKKGVRLSIKKYTPSELINKFPELKKHYDLLTVHETLLNQRLTIDKLIKENRELQRNYNELANDYKQISGC